MAQTKTHKQPPQCRVDGDEIQTLVLYAQSPDASKRLTAAKFLCPCHIRRNIPEAWDALYRMLRDSNVNVRRAAWHTITDGGRPDDPRLDQIIAHTLQTDSDEQVLEFARPLQSSRDKKETARVHGLGLPKPRGKCDFCARANVGVQSDYSTSIPTATSTRPALICDVCLPVGWVEWYSTKPTNPGQNSQHILEPP